MATEVTISMDEFLKISDEIQTQLNEWQTNHAKFVEKGNASAGSRARKALGEVKNLVTAYRKISTGISAESKAEKAAANPTKPKRTPPSPKAKKATK